MTLPGPVTSAISALENQGFEAVAVGGCVRDLALGLTPKDYDIATSALPNQVLGVFKNESVIPTGLKHGTVTLILAGGMPIEITTYRIDGAYPDHRRPESVSFTGSLEADLARRDFTVNAMAYSPSKGLVDPMEGMSDLQMGIIRAVGEADRRFREDALRILRALRFAARYEFKIENETAFSILRMKDHLKYVARERIGAEIAGLLSGRGARSVLITYRPVLEAAIPALSRVSSEAYDRAAGAVTRAKASRPAQLAAFLAPLQDSADNVLISLRTDSATRRRTMALIGWLKAVEQDPAKVLGALGEEDARALYDIGEAPGDRRSRLDELIDHGACVTIRQLAVNGNDLKGLGLSGPAVGEALEKLLDAVVTGKTINSREALLSRIRTLM